MQRAPLVLFLGAATVVAAAPALAQDAPHPESPGDQARLRGVELLEAGDLQGALRELDRAVGLDPGDAAALFKRGEVKHRLGDPKGAVEDYGAAIEIMPGHAHTYNNRGVALDALGRHEEAVADFGEALRLEPEYGEANFNRAVALIRLRRLEEAVADCDAALRLRQDDPRVYHLRGVTRFRLGQLEGAEEDLLAAIELRPTVGLYRFVLGDTRTRRGDYAGAIEAYTAAREVGADGRPAAKLDAFHQGRARSSRGRARALAGDREGALVDLRAAAAELPDVPYLPLWISGLGGGDEGLERVAKSPEWIAQVAKHYLGELDAEALLATVEQPEGDEAKAPSEFKVRGRRCEAHCFIALRLEREGDPAGARRHYEAAVATEVDQFTEYHWAKARLKALEAR